MTSRDTKRVRQAAALALGAMLLGAGLWWWIAAPREPASLGPGAYALRYAFEMDLAMAGGARQKVSATIDGTLDLVRRGDDAMMARVRVANVTLDEGARRLGFLRDGADAALATPFSLATAPDGRVTAVRLAPGLPLSVRSVLATIANGTQYVRAEQPHATEWRTTETDMNGSYRATYRFAGPDAVEKAWTLGEGDPLASLRGKATARFTLEGPRVQAVTVDQKGDTLTGQADGPRSPFTLALSLTRTGDADDTWVEGKDDTGLVAFTTATGVPKNVRVAGPEPRPRDELLNAVAKAPADETLAEHTPLRAELTEAVIRDPVVGEALEKLLRRNETGLGPARHAVEALLGARTPEADRRVALLLVDRTVPATARTMLLGGATLLDNPGPKVVDAVRDVAKAGEKSFHGQAAMALGGIASNLAPVDPPKADEIARELLGMAEHVLNPGPDEPPVPFGWKTSFLKALGNLGTPECLPLVRRGLEDDDELVRAVAARALRHQSPAAVMDDLARGMRDPSLEVRAAVLKSARKLGPAATLDLVKTALYFDKSEYVRLQAVYTFGAWSHEAPALLQVLTDAAAHEKSPKVQQAIRHMTEKNRIEPPFVSEPLGEGER